MRLNPSLVLVAVVGLACSKSPPPAAPAPSTMAGSPVGGAPSMMPPAAAMADVIAGPVLETIGASQYTYLRIQTPSGEIWAAVPASDIAVGAQARIVGAVWMQDFKSETLKRTWPRIAFGTLEAQGAGAPAQAAGARPAGAFAEAAAGKGSPAAPPSDGTPISVPRATGKNAHTIAEVLAQKAALKDQTVRIQGKVVKETDGVMGKNWLHLRDGTGKDGAADLTFATADASAVGETIILAGTVHLDRDLGAGYHYDVLIEDAHIERK